VHVVGADTHAERNAEHFQLPGATRLVLGNEREGLSPRIRAQCDTLIGIRGSGVVDEAAEEEPRALPGAPCCIDLQFVNELRLSNAARRGAAPRARIVWRISGPVIRACPTPLRCRRSPSAS
jgi:hypothetical protein